MNKKICARTYVYMFLQQSKKYRGNRKTVVFFSRPFIVIVTPNVSENAVRTASRSQFSVHHRLLLFSTLIKPSPSFLQPSICTHLCLIFLILRHLKCGLYLHHFRQIYGYFFSLLVVKSGVEGVATQLFEGCLGWWTYEALIVSIFIWYFDSIWIAFYMNHISLYSLMEIHSAFSGYSFGSSASWTILKKL